MLLDSMNGLKSSDLVAGHSCGGDLVEDCVDTGEGTQGALKIESNEMLAGTV